MKVAKVLPLSLMLASIAMWMVAGCDEAPPRAEPPAPKVVVSKPEIRPVVDYFEFNGWLEPEQTVEMRAQVSGYLDKVHFKDGDIVKQGDLLFELDPRPFQSDVDRANDQVQIFEAQYTAAAKEEKRLRELVGKGGASQSQVDSAEAQTKSLTAQIEGAKQEVVRKKLDLEYSRIVAPITGKISRAMLTAGNLINGGPGSQVLTTIVSVDPIYAYFDMDERTLQEYRKSHASATTQPVNLREANMPFEFGLESEKGYPRKGMLDFANNRVDPQTGTIQVRGVVPNPDVSLIGGSRVSIRVPVSDAKPTMLIPDTAILSDQDKKYVLVIDDKNVVHRRDIIPGKLLDDGSRVILLPENAKTTTSPEEWVITEGIQLARLNYPVDPIRPTTQPTSTAVAQ